MWQTIWVEGGDYEILQEYIHYREFLCVVDLVSDNPFAKSVVLSLEIERRQKMI